MNESLDPDIAYFMAVAAAGSVGRAAEHLGMTQPALTKAVQRLERRLRVTLFLRSARGSELTEAGARFLLRCQSAAHALDDAVQEARDIGGGHAGLLRIGMSPASAHFVVGALFPRLREDRPGAVVQLHTAFGDTLLEALQRQELGVVVCPMPLALPAEVQAETLYDDDFCVVVHDRHPLAHVPEIDLHELLQCDFAASGRQEFARRTIEDALQSRGLPLPRVKVEANTLEALVMIAAHSQLVTLIPRRALPPHACPPNLVWRPVSLPGVRRQIAILTRQGYVSPLGQRAMELLRLAATERLAPGA